ncbi:MAG TPA: FAD-dependent oxidoreductase, partial [Thermoanaerobaculia bacterium]|nr:FAD-dependent oxidoreductase [Thermoanaerobaculia bacterium]
EHPLRVAIVGTGPSGMYAAQSLLQQDGPTVSIDLFDRLPAPWGLVRYGVAPDHQKIKNVIRVFEKTADDPRVSFFGHVHFGRDLTREDLLRHYHQVVYAVGAQGDREMGISGEDLAGSWSSTEFVNWYNCHPDLADSCYPLEHERVAVVGIGNVAMDVTRILARPAEELATTDISDEALRCLRASRVREIHVLARRGPVQAKCSPAELREVGELAGVQVVVDAAELELDPTSEAELADDRAAQKNLELWRQWAEQPLDPDKRHVRFRFMVSPVEVLAADSRVAGLRVERNRLEPRPGGGTRPVGSGEAETLPVTLVIRAIGYKSLPLVDLPYDARRAVVPNDRGRVIDPGAGEAPLAREYVVGWVKRGPSGLIGSNKMDAAETVERMMEEVPELAPLPGAAATRREMERLLAGRGVRFVTYDDWRRLDAREVERGRRHGRPRVKFLRVEEMLAELDADTSEAVGE